MRVWDGVKYLIITNNLPPGRNFITKLTLWRNRVADGISPISQLPVDGGNY